MKIYFLKEHSLYKIFKTLEKVPVGKTVQIFFDPEHSFFENEWWWTQIQDLLKKRDIKATFVAKTERHKKFFEKIGLDVIYQEENKVLKALRFVYMFFFNIKKFHLYVYTKKNFVFYLVFAFEAFFILGILYLLYSLILPSVKVEIFPSHQVDNIIYNFRYYPHNDLQYLHDTRYLSIPFYTGFLDYQYDMSISVSHLQHIQHPSAGIIKVYNKTEKEYSFVPNTRLETSDGRMFKTLDWFKLDPGTERTPGEAMIKVEAMEKDANGVYMGVRGNIKKGVQMYIKNLKASFYLKDIYAKAIEDFTGGIYRTEWEINNSDIAILSGKLYDYIQKQKKNIVSQNFNLEGAILLPFGELMHSEVKNIKIHNKAGEKIPQVQWTVVARLHFMYIKLDDLLKVVHQYLKQRPSEKVQLITIDTNTLSFFDNLKFHDGVYIVPTKIDAIEWYDFHHDVNGILEDIKTRILGKQEVEARKIILGYPEVSTVHLKIKPLWYSEIPKLRSRIRVKIIEE